MANNHASSPIEEEIPSWVDSDRPATEEEKNWDDEGALTTQKNRNKMGLIKTIGRISPVFVIVFSLIFIASFISWSWHFIMPEYYQWLTSEQLSKIQSIIFSGSMGAIVSSYLRNNATL
jgi:hypothetical protein